jgi:hypothetical protein
VSGWSKNAPPTVTAYALPASSSEFAGYVVVEPIVNVVLTVTAPDGILRLLVPLDNEPPSGLITADDGPANGVNELNDPPPQPTSAAKFMVRNAKTTQLAKWRHCSKAYLLPNNTQRNL